MKASRASDPLLFIKPAGRPAIAKLGSFQYEFCLQILIAYHVIWNFQILISLHLKNK